MFDHVTIRVSDRDASERFYALVLRMLGIEQTHSGDQYAEWNDFSLAQAAPDRPATRNFHVAFIAQSRAAADEFWRSGVDAGYRDEGAPGPRPQYSATYYGAFLLDPDGNSAEAVHHDSLRDDGGGIDHLWIRVADVETSKRFYETIAPFASFRLDHRRRGFAHFRGPVASFSLVAGAPTEHLHMAFPAEDNATVDAFHRGATAAGYRDNGAPGERPVYHAGYYGAYVLDPDGNNVEFVSHNR